MHYAMAEEKDTSRVGFYASMQAGYRPMAVLGAYIYGIAQRIRHKIYCAVQIATFLLAPARA